MKSLKANITSLLNLTLVVVVVIVCQYGPLVP